MKIDEIYKNSNISFIGLNYNNDEILSVKKYFVVDNDFLIFFARKKFNLNLLIDDEDHSNELGLKLPCICYKKIKDQKYFSLYYKERSLQKPGYENYHLNCFEKIKNDLFLKKYYYTKDKEFIKNILKDYSFKNTDFDALEICKGYSYRNKSKSDKIAIIDENNNYEKLKAFEIPKNCINFNDIFFIAFGQDKHSNVRSYYFTSNITWRLPEDVVYNYNEAV